MAPYRRVECPLCDGDDDPFCPACEGAGMVYESDGIEDEEEEEE